MQAAREETQVEIKGPVTREGRKVATLSVGLLGYLFPGEWEAIGWLCAKITPGGWRVAGIGLYPAKAACLG